MLQMLQSGGVHMAVSVHQDQHGLWLTQGSVSAPRPAWTVALAGSG